MLLKQIEIFSSFPASAVNVFTYLSMTCLILSFDDVCIHEKVFLHVQLLESIWFLWVEVSVFLEFRQGKNCMGMYSVLLIVMGENFLTRKS